MPISLKFYYLFFSSYFLLIWLWIFIKLPRYRRDMLWMSLAASWIGLTATFLWWNNDWWHPETITGTRVGIEDFMMSVSHLGIGVFGYMYIFRKTTLPRFTISIGSLLRLLKRFFLWFLISFGTTFVLFHWLALSSFSSTLIGMILAATYLLFKRIDLARPMLWSGTSFLATSLPIYIISELIFPGSVRSIWFTGNLTGATIIGIPIEDLIWYFLLGLFLGGAYPYLTKSRYIDSESS